MDKEKIERINFLAKKSKTEGLSESEAAEQAELRREYIEAYKASLRANLDNTYIVDADGSKQKLNAIGIAFYSGSKRKAYFEIYTSNDGVEWTYLKECESSGESEEFDIESDEKNIRLKGLGRAGALYAVYAGCKLNSGIY